MTDQPVAVPGGTRDLLLAAARAFKDSARELVMYFTSLYKSIGLSPENLPVWRHICSLAI